MTPALSTFAADVKRWIRSRTDKGAPIYDIRTGPDRFLIEETEKDGRAELWCTIPEGYSCAVFQMHGKDGLWGFLNRHDNADGAVLVLRPSGGVVAWIVECKKTVAQKNWEKALVQFEWTLARLLAVAGVLELRIDEILFATAFREEQLSEDESPNPTFGKSPIGPSSSDEVQTIDWARRQQLAWTTDEVTIRGRSGKFRHTKLRLDANGDGSCQVDG